MLFRSGLDTRGVYVPIGQATGSQETVLAAFDDIMQVLDGDAGRIVPCHDFQAYERYPSREILLGIRVAEVASAHLG